MDIFNVEKRKNIVVDIFGSDNPDAILSGCVDCINSDDGIMLTLAGDEKFLSERLSAFAYNKEQLKILDAPEVITNNENPVQALMLKRSSSLVRAIGELSATDAIGLISAGSTGALLLGCAAFLGMLPGVKAPALAALLPSAAGRDVVLVDCGANVDAPAEQLSLFALMGIALLQSCEGVENPSVAVVSVGVEDNKGSRLSKELFSILREMPINFVGNMEARDALSGKYDVMVCDGFAGNILLKTTEGTALFVIKETAAAMKRYLPKGTDPSFIKQTVAAVMDKLDFSSNGGGILLGVKKPVIKIHGNANEKTIPNTVSQLLRLSADGYIDKTVSLLNGRDK